MVERLPNGDLSFGDRSFGLVASIGAAAGADPRGILSRGVDIPRLAPRTTDALEVHSYCLDYFSDPRKMSAFWKSLEGGRVPGDFDNFFADKAPRAIMETISVAETFWCAPPICDLLEHTSKALPLDWTLRPEHALVENGFLILGQPRRLPMRPENDWLAFAGILWWHIKPQSGRTDQGGLFCSILNWVGSRTPVMPMSTIYWPFGQSLGSMIDHSKTVVDDQDDSVYKPSSGLDDASELKARERGTVEFEWRLLSTIFAFIEQRILVTQRELVDRAARKRLEKTGWDHDPAVNVVTLRRVHRDGSSAGDGEPHDWQFQWTVRGHWRKQYYPSVSAHKTIWVMPYVKGPEGKPLKPPKPTLFSVSR